MNDSTPAIRPTDRHALGQRTVNRLGYGAMQLAGPGVFGPPKDRGAALAVLRAAVEGGVDHIDTSAHMSRTRSSARRWPRIRTR
jgi:aryl-alcohol dehydrogenase-like predicted oxidoreductase